MNNIEIGDLKPDDAKIEIEEWKPELLISKPLNEQSSEDIIQNIDFGHQVLTKRKCHICDIVYENLDLHFLTTHSEQFENILDEKLRFGCYIEIHRLDKKSKKMIKSSYVNNSHEKTIKSSNKCNFCGKSFTTGGSLKRHVKAVHEVVKDHVCNLCGKSFSQGIVLKRHVKAVHE